MSAPEQYARPCPPHDDPLELTAPLDPPIDWVWLTEEDAP